jgi:hypothetical protein
VSSFRRKASAILLAVLALTYIFVFYSGIGVQSAEAETATSLAASHSANYNLTDLAQHLSQLKDANVTTTGVVRFLASVYMYEDFWLQSQGNQTAKIPVVTRFAGISKPGEGDLVKVQGTIAYINLEGGFFVLNASSVEKIKNVLLIGWDGAQRNHLLDMLNRRMLPNLQALINDGAMANVTVSDHRTDTKSGWTQILTGYRWFRTGVYSNVLYFNSIPANYTIPERVESRFGKDAVKTGFIAGKEDNIEIQDGVGWAATGIYTRAAIYGHLPPLLDFVNVGDRSDNEVGSLALQFMQNNSDSHFFAFFHFGDIDAAGHRAGENSALYEQAMVTADYWLGQIVSELKTLNLTQNTLIYITADHGFDEGLLTHFNAPYTWLVTNDKLVSRSGDEVDVAPTIYYGLGMWDSNFEPALDGYPMQLSLPDGVEQHREIVLDNHASMIKPTFVTPKSGANVSGVVNINFNVSDIYLNAVILLINNTMVADGPWTWSQSRLVEANCSYSWNTTSLTPGTYELRVFLFDERGWANGPEQGAVTVNVTAPPPVTIPEFILSSAIILLLCFLGLTSFVVLKKGLNVPNASAHIRAKKCQK